MAGYTLLWLHTVLAQQPLIYFCFAKDNEKTIDELHECHLTLASDLIVLENQTDQASQGSGCLNGICCTLGGLLMLPYPTGQTFRHRHRVWKPLDILNNIIGRNLVKIIILANIDGVFFAEVGS